MDPWPSNAPIPGRLPVLGLPYPMVLHPGLVLSIPMPQAQCLGLLRTALQERKAHDAPRVGQTTVYDQHQSNK